MLFVLKEVVHIQEQCNHQKDVKDSKEHQSPIEESTSRNANSLDDSAIIAYAYHEAQEKLIIPFEFLYLIVSIWLLEYKVF